MELRDSVALVTGANRGLGREFVNQLLERGARTVYATSRTEPVDRRDRVRTFTLDVTSDRDVERAVASAPDLTLLVNNAGISTLSPLVSGDLDAIRRELDTHFWGTLRTTRAFAPTLAANGGGAILNLLSALAWQTYEGAAAYAAAKAATWSLTDSVRLELLDQGTQVTGLFAGAIDTELMAGFDVPKSDPADIVRAALDGVASGLDEVMADDTARDAKASLGSDPRDRFDRLRARSVA